MGLSLDDVITPGGHGPWQIQLLLVAEAPSLTRLSIRREGLPVADLDLTPVDLECHVELCRRHAERARRHLRDVIDAAFNTVIDDAHRLDF